MAGSSYYEAHVTMQADVIYRERIKRFVESQKWKFSAIDGDINLGDGVKMYATRQFNGSLQANEVVAILKFMAIDCKKLAFVEVIRQKVELVIYDDRSSKVDCTATECSTCPSIST